MANLRENDPFPAFDLPDSDGVRVSLADFKGRAFVVYAYPKDDTSGCTIEAKDFSQLAPDFAAIDVPVLGISPDPVKSHAKFRDKHDLTVRLLSDEDKVLLGALGLWVEKSMYGRTYMGAERTTILVDRNGRIARVWPKVRVADHAAEVLSAASAMQAGADAS